MIRYNIFKWLLLTAAFVLIVIAFILFVTVPVYAGNIYPIDLFLSL